MEKDILLRLEHCERMNRRLSGLVLAGAILVTGAMSRAAYRHSVPVPRLSVFPSCRWWMSMAQFGSESAANFLMP